MNKRSIVFNVIWSVIGLIINTAITMMILPYVSNKMGIEAYGYIALCNNIVMFIDLIASTINVYAVRFISIEYHKGNLKRTNEYYSSVFIVNIIIVAVLIVPTVLCVTYIDRIFNIPDILISDIRILFSLNLVNYLIILINTVFTSAAFVKDILYIDARIKAEGNMIRGILIIVLFSMLYPHVWYVTIATLICSVFIMICNINLSYKYVPELKINFSFFSYRLIRRIASNGIWNTIASLGTILNSGLDLLVTNIYLGPTKMGQLSIPKILSNFIAILLTAVTNSFRPQLLAFNTKGETEKLNTGFLLSMKSCGLVTCAIFSVFSAFGFQFLQLWIPDQNTALIYNLCLLTFLSEIFTGFVKPLHYGCVLTGKLKVPCIANLLVGALNVISMIVFLNITNGGLYVVAITTVVGNITYNFIVMPFYVCSILDISRKQIYKLIVQYIFITGVVSGGFFCVFRRVNIANWIILLIWLVISSAIVELIYGIIILNGEERGFVLKEIENKIRFRK